MIKLDTITQNLYVNFLYMKIGYEKLSKSNKKIHKKKADF